MKTVKFWNDPRVHIIGVEDLTSDPGHVNLRTNCDEYYSCPVDEVGEEVPTCVECVSGVSAWLEKVRASGFSEVRTDKFISFHPLKVL